MAAILAGAAAVVATVTAAIGEALLFLAQVLVVAIIIIAILYILYMLWQIGKVVVDYFTTTAPPLSPPLVDKGIPTIQPKDIPIDEPLVKPVPIPITKPRTKNKDKDIWNVYDVHILKSGKYRRYTFGDGYIEKEYLKGQIYKYGITSFPHVNLRYSVLFYVYGGDKDKYFADNLTYKNMGAKEWYLSLVKKVKALKKEADLLRAYLTKHGELPPANTKIG